jgi:hypothetical protein
VYDYSDVSTLKKFALCNKRVKCIVGPFGPLSNDTEYLSKSGWKRIEDYPQSGEEIMEYDLDTGKGIFSVPEHYIVQPCDEFIHFKSDSIDMMLSPEHRVLVKDGNGRIKVRSAEEMYHRHHTLKSMTNDVIPVTFNFFNETSIPLTEFQLRLSVAVVADGSFHKHMKKENATYNTNGCCMGFTKKRKIKRLRWILFCTGIPYKESSCKNGVTYFYFQAPVKKKVFDEYFWQANYFQRKIICDELSHWDGNKRSDGIVEFYSTVKENADFIQYCFASTGVGSTIQIREKRIGDSYGIKTAYITRSFSVQKFVGIKKDPNAVQYEKYGNGYKYCFATHTGFFVARRNNKIFITGNSGKSTACVMEIIRKAHEQAPGPDGIRRTRWAVVRNTFSQLKDTTIKTFHDWFPPRVFGEYRVTDHVYLITKFPGVQIEVLFRALDRPDQVSNLLSLELTGAWFNEVREIPKTIIEAMDGRIGRYPAQKDGGCTWLGMIMDTNPPDDDSYVYKMFEVVKPDNWEIFKQPSGLSAHAENLSHLPKNYYINLAKGKDDMYVRVYIHGQYGFLLDGKPVFTGFVDSKHVASHILEPIKGLDLLVGLDFGLQPACTIGQITPFGQLRILDELVSDGMAIRQFCQNQLLPLLRTKYWGYNVMGYGDPSGISRAPTDESTCFDILHSAEIGLTNVIPAYTNAIVPRVNAVDTFLSKMINGEPGIIFSPNCKYLRKAMNGGYHYAMEKSYRGGEQDHKRDPVKNFSSHIADSLEELCLYIDQKEVYDKEKKSFLAQLKQVQHNVASRISGY